jgi:hypothetical protein
MISPLRRPAGLRQRLLAVVVLATLVALAATIAGFNLLLASRLDSTADDLLRTQISAERAEVMIVGGRVTLPDLPESGPVIGEPVWVFSGPRLIERPRNLAALDRDAIELAGGASARSSPPRRRRRSGARATSRSSARSCSPARCSSRRCSLRGGCSAPACGRWRA